MKVLVIGATGFVGSQIVAGLLRHGDDVCAIVRPGSHRGTVAEIPGVHFLEADVLTPDGRARIANSGCDVCIHAAWFVEPGNYLASLTNIDFLCATVELARIAAAAGFRRFVGVGTCFEYDLSAGYLSEKSRLGPAHLYSAAKASSYLALKELGAVTGMEIAWARLFYLYGPREHPARLVPSLARALLRGEETRCTLGRQVRDFLHVEDAGDAIAAVAHSDLIDAVNIGSGEPTTVADVVHRLASLCGRPDLVRLGALPYSPGDPMFICADVSRLSTRVGWRPRWTMTEGLSDALAWWARCLDMSR